MDYMHAFFLALLQGLTEFLPVSSSAHLILLPVLFNWKDQGLAFDLAVHVGTLGAVVAYFRKELRLIIMDWCASFIGKGATDEAKLAWFVIIGTVPVIIFGIAVYNFVETVFRSPLVIAIATIAFGILLWVADRRSVAHRESNLMTWKDGLIIGAFQALALIPGTSRSGITITAGLFLGFRPDFAARFSFLLSIPAITLPALVTVAELVNFPGRVDWGSLLIGTIVSATVAYLTIKTFLKWLSRIGLLPFVIYRLLLGVGLLAIFYTDLLKTVPGHS